MKRNEMIDTDALKRDKRPQSAWVVHALIDRLEAAESEALEQARLNGMGSSREAALAARLEAAERERDWHAERCEDAMNECAALRSKIEAMEKRLRLILEEPENTMSNSKALREMVRQARLALEESK